MNELLLDNRPCSTLRGVGPKLSQYLAKCNILTIQDLLFHLPIRYQDRTHISKICTLKAGEYAVIEGLITQSRLQRGKKTSFICELEDETGQIKLYFFYFTFFQQKSLVAGTKLRCYGEVKQGAYGLVMMHPEYRTSHSIDDERIDECLTPIYPATEGLSQYNLRQLTEQALEFLAKGALLKEYLPPSICQKFELSDLNKALRYVHRPPPNADLSLLMQGSHPMQQRLAFEELVTHHVSVRRIRKLTQKYPALPLFKGSTLVQQFLQSLPFKLTGAQQRVMAEINSDLEKSTPMLRLVQGDVGAGKTIVAMIALLQAVSHGYQAVLMAPTEILAKQHFATVATWMEPLGITTRWLSGKLKGSKRKELLALLKQGNPQIIIGTHALFQPDVIYSNLALVIIDEQHRFGVHQRMALRDKGGDYYPHQLIMTATPIPRTLAMVAYADLDTSIIDELPPGRTPVATLAVPNTRRQEVLQRVMLACQQGCQAYWVCTLIEESEVLECQAAEDTFNQLKENLPSLTVGLIHGRMPTEQKNLTMQAFKLGEIQLLVATTVIEVGVDVANASLMIIENPERLGLAQLHQLRGRVGRGAKISHCVLLYQPPLSSYAKQRLEILRKSHDGFEIAQKDLELRGPGELLGTRQTGIIQFKIADLNRDSDLLHKAQQAAEEIMKNYSDLEPLLIQRWIGYKEHYSHV